MGTSLAMVSRLITAQCLALHSLTFANNTTTTTINDDNNNNNGEEGEGEEKEKCTRKIF